MITGRPTWVVIPARDEADHIAPCLDALQRAERTAPGPVRVVLVDDGSTDATATIAQSTFTDWATTGRDLGSGRDLRGTVVAGPGAGVGWARRVGFEWALAEAASVRRRPPLHGQLGMVDPAALLATTDADSQVAPDWLTVLHQRLDTGHVVVAGDVILDDQCDPLLVTARAARLAARLAALPSDEAGAGHPHFAGSNLAFAIEVLAMLGPLPTPVALEDQAILERCRALSIPVLRDAQAVVVTSSRTVGRARNGLADALRGDLRVIAAT